MGYVANAGQLLIDFIFGAAISLFLLRLLAEGWRVEFRNPVSQFLYRFTNPVLAPLRKLLPTRGRVNGAALLVAWVLELLKVVLTFALVGLFPGLGGWLLLAAARLLDFLLLLYVVLIFGWALASMIGGDPLHPLLRFVAQLVEPPLRPLRRRLPSLGGLDFSPAVAILALLLARILVAQPLIDLGTRWALGAA